VTANLLNPESEVVLPVLDHVPLTWIGNEREQGHATKLSLSSGISREASLAVLGRPLDLYDPVGLTPRTAAEVSANDRRVTSSCGVFDVQYQSGIPVPFLYNDLIYMLRIDVTARDLDTVSYESAFQIEQRWEGPGLPTTHAERNSRGVDITLNWSAWSKTKHADEGSGHSKVWIGDRRFD
jgi:hypothetical protein